MVTVEMAVSQSGGSDKDAESRMENGNSLETWEKRAMQLVRYSILNSFLSLNLNSMHFYSFCSATCVFCSNIVLRSSFESFELKELLVSR